jgi:undecaprenyl-diphosphatase
MNFFQAIVMGIVQGLTEFIPVSSSAHLVLVPWALDWPNNTLAFDTMLHWGTLLAVMTYFWSDWVAMAKGFFRSLTTSGPWNAASGGRFHDADSRLAWWVILGTIPAALIGFAFDDFFESLFNNVTAVGFFLLVTALILFLAERYARGERPLVSLRLPDALIIGLAQAAAIAPGISRSGATIATGMARGLSREAAARYSFLLSAPAIFGAGVLQLAKLAQEGIGAEQVAVMAAGFVAAAITGYLCIKYLLAYLRRGSLYVFSAYCAVLGALVLAATLLF